MTDNIKNGRMAIILGATGLTGSFLLRKLLSDNLYSKVIVLGRKSVGIEHDKLEEHVVDILELEKYAELIKGDVLFCCIGTTAKKTPDKTKYRLIDYGIPVSVAKLCKENNVSTIIVISSLGADPESKIFYTKLKGEMEEDVISEGVTNTYVIQPSIIGGPRQEYRLGEKIGVGIAKAFGFLMVGKLRNYRIIQAEDIANAMLYLDRQGHESARVDSKTLQTMSDRFTGKTSWPIEDQ